MVIFACVHNSGRSQMAAAFYNQIAGGGATSAGTQPGTRVHPEVVEAMKEVGIDLSEAKPRLLTNELARDAHLLITLGCGEACPYLPELKRMDWPMPDPKNKSLEEVRAIRDEIKRRVVLLINSEQFKTV